MAKAVKFVYVSAGKQLPPAIDRSRDTIYFVEDAQQIWIGDRLFADHIDPLDLDTYLSEYKVKSVDIIGEGTLLSAADFDEITGILTLTRTTPPSVAKGVDGPAADEALSPGDSFSAVTGTSVSDNTIYNDIAKFVLPHQISGVKIERSGESNKLVLTVTSTDGTEKTSELLMFGSAAFTDVNNYATHDQGQKADEAMPASGGRATEAHISLAKDPETEMEAATKQYVDNSVKDLTGAMHFLGVSTTKISDGNREHPHINGSEIDTDTIDPGDVVLYSPSNDGNYLEFVWASKDGVGCWIQLGDESSYAHKDIRVSAGEGVSGGGSLESDVTISHGSTGSGEDKTFEFEGEGSSILTGIHVDKFGHVKLVSCANLNDLINATVESLVNDAIESNTSVAHEEDIPSWTVIA